VDLERRQARPGARQRAVVRHHFAAAELQELPERQAVGATPGDAALALQALETAHEQHPEVAPGRDRRPPDPARVARRAQTLDLTVEPDVVEHRVQAIVEHLSRRRASRSKAPAVPPPADPAPCVAPAHHHSAIGSRTAHFLQRAARIPPVLSCTRADLQVHRGSWYTQRLTNHREKSSNPPTFPSGQTNKI
jgi:hypothetical protein